MLTTAVALSESDEEDDVPQRKKKGNMLAKVCICYALTAAHAPIVMILVVVVWFKGLCQWTVSFAPVLLSSEAKALGRYDGCDLGAVVLPCLRDAAGLTYI